MRAFDDNNSRHGPGRRGLRGRLVTLLATASIAASSAIPAGALVATQLGGLAPTVAAAGGSVTLNVVSARAWAPAGLVQGEPIPHYQWLITKDDTGDGSQPASPNCTPQSLGGDPNYPANCNWPSIRSIPGGTTAEVVAQGNETTQPSNLPNGKYMVSVTADGFDTSTNQPCTSNSSTCVDGFKVDGAWFSVPADSSVTVELQPYPLPLATIRARVWNDLQTNGAYDTGEPTLAGFTAKLSDIGGPIQSDWYGNPLCTTYQHDSNGVMLFDSNGHPLVQQLGGKCVSDANGDIVIPYMPPQRYSVEVVPPDGQTWYQTTTLEGWHDWDTWAIQGWNGYDPEFIQGGEPFPFAEFGFVQVHTGSDPSTPFVGSGTGSIKGTVLDTTAVSPAVGGVPLGGAQGNIVLGPMNRPLLSLVDTNLNDTTIYVGRGNADGTFQINGVPDGDYVLYYWDEDQSYLLTGANVHVENGQAVDLGNVDAAAWWGEIHGRVCFDTNRNGKCESGEAGIPGLALNLLGRDNSLQPSGDNTAVTDANGNYEFPRTYPLGQWVVEQGYWEQYYTVGVTYQSINQPTETTQMANGGFVDVSTLNAIGMQTRIDWAVHTYETPTDAAAGLGPSNGGIVGENYYNNVQIESEGRFQTIQPSEPGIPGFTMHVYKPVSCDPAVTAPAGQACTTETTAFGTAHYLTNSSDGTLVRATGFPVPCDPADPTPPPAGDTCAPNADSSASFLKDSGGQWVTGSDAFTPYTSETWHRPVDCVARDADGKPVQEQVLPPSTGGHECLEAPLMESQASNNADTGIGMEVNGNYGFTQVAQMDGSGNPVVVDITAGDWIVSADSPTDVNGKPIWRPSLEEDVNGYTGDEMVAPGETPTNPPTPAQPPATPTPAPAIPPFPCVGPMHTVHLVDNRADANFDITNPSTTQGIYNPGYMGAGGSPYEGRQMPLCDQQLVTVRNGRSATPNFPWIDSTWVPLPSRIFGLVVDDLNLSYNPKELFFGEKYGIPNLPVGIYDFSNRLIKTVNTDPNGMFEVELPSTTISDCPSPASVCPGMYRYLANDPGTPGHPNANYNPAYRTIGAFFESWPGISGPADLAPVPSALTIELPGTAGQKQAQCLLNDPAQPSAPLTPELFSISRPYVRSTDTGTARRFTLTGQSFGASQGSGSLTLDGVPMSIISWGDRQIVFQVPPASLGFPAGPKQLLITGNGGKTSVNGLTFHVLGTGYSPTILEVGPGKAYDPGAAAHNTGGYEHAVQDAVNAAAGSAQALVVVYPGPTSQFNPLGGYFENLIVHSPLKLQGVGPGGVYPDGTHVPGSVLDGLGFGTDSARDTGWAATLAAVPNLQAPAGTEIPMNEVVLFVATGATQYGSTYRAAIDGMTIQNGDVADFVALRDAGGNGPTAFPEVAGTTADQGGGVVAFDSTRYLRITNNIIRSNTGNYGGGIRLGTPTVGSNNLPGIAISHNRILNNGGANLAGAVGVFAGSTGYEIDHNDVCGNFSAEYGGGISHFGLSGGSTIHDNRIYFNGSYDEGAGVIVAGEPPLTPTGLSAGAGAVDVYNNLIQGNLANDDGGGLRFLTAGNFPFNVYNNIIANNISTHEGGGVAIDNAPNVRFFNNTVMKNITTATAATSNGQPAPAGLSSATNDDRLQATLPAGSPTFSNPLLFNNIFWDNRAGTWDPTAGIVRGIGAKDLLGQADSTPLEHWDMGVPGTSFQLSPTNSILQSETTNHGDVVASATNKVDQDPVVKDGTYDTSILTLPWRGNPNFIANVIVAADVPVTIMGDYHLLNTSSPANNAGAASKALPSYQQPPASRTAPATDIDGDARPSGGGYEMGADEIGAGATTNLSITKTDGTAAVIVGQSDTYTITVSNAGPSTATAASVIDTFPAALTGVTWTCAASAGSSCGQASGTGNISTTVNLLNGGTATFTATGTVSATATSPLTNTATVTAGAGTTDPNPANNSSTDTDAIVGALPALTVLDNFNRANATTLGANWSQGTIAGAASIRVNSNQAFALLPGQAVWNSPSSGFGAKQAAAFTVANTTLNNDALILKATGGTANLPASFTRVRYSTSSGGQVIVETTTNSGLSYTNRATFAGTLANGNTLSVVIAGDGTLVVYKTAGATTTAVGSVVIPGTQGTGTGRIGIQLPTGARVDDFAGGTLP